MMQERRKEWIKEEAEGKQVGERRRRKVEVDGRG